MKVHRLLIEWLDSPRADHKPSVVCLGFFDGVHVGHQAILNAARAIRARDHLVFCVHTYASVPAGVLCPGADIVELTPLDEKAALLEGMGVELLAISRFDKDLMAMPGAAFVRLLADRLNVRHMVAGFDHRFGYRADTDARRLVELCAPLGIQVTVVDPVRTADGEAVSSTAIRAALAAGDVRRAEQMLGRPLSARMRGLTPRHGAQE